ncbi:MAG: PmoA family protein [Bacteroidota bacterium]
MKYSLFFCLIGILLSCQEKELIGFQVGEGNGFLYSGPVSVDLEALGRLNGDAVTLLYEGRSLPFQVKGKKLWFVHQPEKEGTYYIENGEKNGNRTSALSISNRNGNYDVMLKGIPLVTYRHAMTYPPKGVDSLYAKSGYLHPIRTPKGDTLTRIQPPDHYHHYGLWGPWTHTRIDTTRVDFWNLGQGMGTVLFKEFKETVSGEVFGSFVAAQEHIDLKTKSAPQVALNEDLEVRLWNLERPDRYMLDYRTTFRSPLENGILFEAYRYGGGLGLRFTERWKKDNCKVLTSEGKDRLSADGSNARWCIVSGQSADGRGTNGILFLSHPENRAHPEPMRIWPVDANGGRGDMFFEFCPIRHEEWRIGPDSDYSLKYRMVVFDGELSAEEAEAYWQAFAHPMHIEIKD